MNGTAYLVFIVYLEKKIHPICKETLHLPSFTEPKIPH
jgi:hypothetical protein